MESKQDIWPLLTFKALADGINYGQVPNQQPTYRKDGGVWALEQEQLLIDSVLREIDIPKIYLRKLDSGRYKYEVIDGQQRIRALWRFLNDDFFLEEAASDLSIDGQSYPLAERTCSLLDEDVKTKRLFAYPLTVVIISEASEDEVAELFYRLNNGTPLTAAEVRNSMPGKVTKFVRELATHPFFKKCRSGIVVKPSTKWQRKCLLGNQRRGYRNKRQNSDSHVSRVAVWSAAQSNKSRREES